MGRPCSHMRGIVIYRAMKSETTVTLEAGFQHSKPFLVSPIVLGSTQFLAVAVTLLPPAQGQISSAYRASVPGQQGRQLGRVELKKQEVQVAASRGRCCLILDLTRPFPSENQALMLHLVFSFR